MINVHLEHLVQLHGSGSFSVCMSAVSDTTCSQVIPLQFAKGQVLEVWRILSTDENTMAQTRLKKSHNCQMVSPWVPVPPVPPSLPSTNISPPCHFRLLKMHAASLHTWNSSNSLENAVAVEHICYQDFELSNVLTPDATCMILMMWFVDLPRLDKPRLSRVLGQVLGQRLAESALGLRSRGSKIQGWAQLL